MASRCLAAAVACLLVVVVALTLLGSPGAAQPGQSATPDKLKLVCTLSDNQTNAAIAAFAGLMPVFLNDRCANCHNKIDPFAPKGHVDIREEFERYRDRRQVEHIAEGLGPAAKVDVVHAAIARYLDGKLPTSSERVDIMFANACSVCHDPPPGERNWRMAPPDDSFHDKNARELCVHIHTNSETDTPAAFEKHMRANEFILVGFKGTRGLNGLGESIASPYRPKPIIAPNHSAALGHVDDWLTAQRDVFSPNPECGCRPFRYAFEWSASWSSAITAPRATGRGGATARTKIPITFKDDGTFTGEGSVPWNPMGQLNSPGANCKFESESKMMFRIKGRVTPDGTMEISGVTESEAKPMKIVCQTPRGPYSQTTPSTAGAQSTPIALQRMKAEVGAQLRAGHSGGGTSVTITATLVEER